MSSQSDVAGQTQSLSVLANSRSLITDHITTNTVPYGVSTPTRASRSAPGARTVPARGGARRRRASRPRAGALRRRQPRTHRPPAQRWAPAVSGSRGIGQRATASTGALAAPRTAAAGESPRRPRGTLKCAQRAIQRRRPARLRPSTPRRCGSCAAALGRLRRSPARWSTHARAATACKWPRSWSVVRTPEPHSERAMGAALTRPTGIGSASARARACGG